MIQLRLFYDGQCPLCVREMRQLQRHDTAQHLALVDIFTPNFHADFPQINADAAREILHAERPNGELLLGLDATYAAWKIVGKGYWIAPLRWPVVRVIADCCYRFFARNRYSISYWLTGTARCQQCTLPSTDTDKKS